MMDTFWNSAMSGTVMGFSDASPAFSLAPAADYSQWPPARYRPIATTPPPFPVVYPTVAPPRSAPYSHCQERPAPAPHFVRHSTYVAQDRLHGPSQLCANSSLLPAYCREYYSSPAIGRPPAVHVPQTHTPWSAVTTNSIPNKWKGAMPHHSNSPHRSNHWAGVAPHSNSSWANAPSHSNLPIQWPGAPSHGNHSKHWAGATSRNSVSQYTHQTSPQYTQSSHLRANQSDAALLEWRSVQPPMRHPAHPHASAPANQGRVRSAQAPFHERAGSPPKAEKPVAHSVAQVSFKDEAAAAPDEVKAGDLGATSVPLAAKAEEGEAKAVKSKASKAAREPGCEMFKRTLKRGCKVSQCDGKTVRYVAKATPKIRRVTAAIVNFNKGRLRVHEAALDKRVCQVCALPSTNSLWRTTEPYRAGMQMCGQGAATREIAAPVGRLLYVDVDCWVHAGCAEWSGETFEDENGVMHNIRTALNRGKVVCLIGTSLLIRTALNMAAHGADEVLRLPGARGHGRVSPAPLPQELPLPMRRERQFRLHGRGPHILRAARGRGAGKRQGCSRMAPVAGRVSHGGCGCGS